MTRDANATLIARALRDFIVAARKKSGLTQQAVADQLGVSQSYIAHIEKSRLRIDIVELVNLAEVLDFDLDEFVRKLEKVKR